MRLTEKLKDNKGVYYNLIESDVVNGYQAVDKLGQLEDIEEELGIELITLFKASKRETIIYYKKLNKIIEFDVKKIGYQRYKELDFERKTLNLFKFVCSIETFLSFKDYGKTWALTKEELC